MKKDKSLIPKGYYCYSYVKGQTYNYKGPDGKMYKMPKTKPCPYWSIRKGKPKQANGYCSYLGKGDWDFNKEQTLRHVDKKTMKAHGPKFSADEIGFCCSLLWDQVKMGCK